MRIRNILLCAGLGGVLAAIMITTHYGPGLIARPARSTPQLRNYQRTQMLNELSAALTQYVKDHGSLPAQIPSSYTQVCSSLGDNCAQVHFVDLSFLITGGNYVPDLPMDPLGGKGRWGAGFFIQQLADGSIHITAPEAELGKTIATSFTP